jgi:hypothetical protein
MPFIYSTESLKEEHAQIVAGHPDAVVLLQNGPMVYAYGRSARCVCQVRGWPPKPSVHFDAATLDMTTKALMVRGWSVVEAEIG